MSEVKCIAEDRKYNDKIRVEFNENGKSLQELMEELFKLLLAS